MDIFTALDDTSKIKKKLRVSKKPVDDARVKKLPKVEIQQITKTPQECVELLSSCYETNDPLGCTLERADEFWNCITSGKETLVVGVPCKGEDVGTHNLPYSVYQDWLSCTYEDSGGEALCDEFTVIDEIGRTITTKILCECPHEKSWDGNGCNCPENKPFDEADLVSGGGRMIGECCASKLCGEGGDYICSEDVCECAPGWWDDGEGGCTDDPCNPGPNGGTGCEEGNCCETVGNCVRNIGQWDGTGDSGAPKNIPECEAQEGRWIMTDTNICPFGGHCELSICELDRTYGITGDGVKFVISECDPYCTAEKCDLACQGADINNCAIGGHWEFDSCDNTGTPKTCLCTCIPP